MLQTAFQKHPEKCKQLSVSACLGGKDCSEKHTGVCAGRQPADSLFYAHDVSFLRTTLRNRTLIEEE